MTVFFFFCCSPQLCSMLLQLLSVKLFFSACCLMIGAAGVALKLCVRSSRFGEWLRVLCVPGCIHVCWMLRFVCFVGQWLLACFELLCFLSCGCLVIDRSRWSSSWRSLLAQPSLDQLHLCTKEQLCVIADHFDIAVSKQLQEIRNVPWSALFNKGLLALWHWCAGYELTGCQAELRKSALI